MLEAADREQKHREEVERLKRKGFTDPAMRGWIFGNDNGKCPQCTKPIPMWNNGRTDKHRELWIDFVGGVSAREKVILPGVPLTPLWSVARNTDLNRFTTWLTADTTAESR